MDEAGLPKDVAEALEAFVAAAKEALGEDLVALVLFGSAAEARLRPSSDVNVMVVLSRFEAERIDKLREPLRLAHALIRLEAMLLLESELAEAAEAFAVKFADIRSRHRLLAGRDVAAALAPSRAATAARLGQILLNFILRTRERYMRSSLRDEQNAGLVADAAGPLRTAAEILLQLEGRPASSPKEALEALARELEGGRWTAPVASLSPAREEGRLPPGTGARTVLELVALAGALKARAAALQAGP